MVRLVAFPGIASAVPGLAHGVTERGGGTSHGPYASLNLGASCGDDPDAVAANGQRLAEALGGPVRFPRQVHGCTVLSLDAIPAGRLPEGDAVTTATRGAAVGVLGADCPGVLLVDPVRHALALVHSGWRGTLAGIVPATVEALAARHGSRPRDLLAGIGPGISARAYEVGPEVAGAFCEGFPGAAECLARGRLDRSHLDLSLAIRLQLLRSGIPSGSIESTEACTFLEPSRFFSHRRDGPLTGRHALVAMWT